MHFFEKKLKKLLDTLPIPDSAGAACELVADLAPLAAANVARSMRQNSCLTLTPSASEADEFASVLRAWIRLLGLDVPVHVLTEVEHTERQIIPEHECERSRVLNLAQTPGQIFVASIMAAVAPTPPPERFRQAHVTLTPGVFDWPPQKLAAYLTDLDYDNEVEVHLPGEFSWRGGILDVFSPVYDFPIRLDYFGDELESMRFFEPTTQRSTAKADECLIIPRGDTALRQWEDEGYCFADYFRSSELSILLNQPAELGVHLETYADSNWQARFEKLSDGRFPLLVLDDSGEIETTLRPAVHSLDALFAVHERELRESSDLLTKQYLQTNLKRWIEQGYDIAVCCSSQSKLDRFDELVSDNDGLANYPFAKYVADVNGGLIAADAELVVLTDGEIFGTERSVRKRPGKTHAYHADHMLRDTSELSEGSYAVHALYGICRYQGLQLCQFNGEDQEVLVLEFANDVEVYVPLEQAHLVSRYVGAGKKLPRLSKVGGNRWKKVRAEAELAVKDLAAELLRMQALRTTCEGVAFVGDDGAMDSFADAFPYEETVDQEQAIKEVLEDMERPRPMDRLLCGDVGFGKTEVAMRAAFKAITEGKQVAVLVPTTVLCQQHYMTFRERFREFPIIIESLSRFRTQKEQREILTALSEGRVDIVIGTHRLLSTDVRFKDLGIMVVDEEQRFGVQAKEKLKMMRTNVDVLTMTATPIPRTLYLSMSGLRDMSTIITPPLERLPVQTVVCQDSDELVREVILREIQREGQVFVLHNRVQTIEQFAGRVRDLVPEAALDIGHGQMSEGDLEEVMLRFMAGETNVLVCTTIIESGLDIPNANTIIIDRADRFGLAELYQLRGRVGRYHRQAYAYLLIPERSMMLDTARKRLAAIRKYTQLGAGFKLALRDLEIRGAGNLLGREQSGHIAAIGFDLYCRLLREAVHRLKGKQIQNRRQVSLIADFISLAEDASDGRIPASLPRNYIHDESVRVECYRRLSSFVQTVQVDKYAEELRDRFGVLPISAENFLTVARIKIQAVTHGVHAITVRENRLLLETSSGYLKRGNRIPTLKAVDPQERLGEMLEVLSGL